MYLTPKIISVWEINLGLFYQDPINSLQFIPRLPNNNLKTVVVSKIADIHSKIHALKQTEKLDENFLRMLPTDLNAKEAVVEAVVDASGTSRKPFKINSFH